MDKAKKMNIPKPESVKKPEPTEEEPPWMLAGNQGAWLQGNRAACA